MSEIASRAAAGEMPVALTEGMGSGPKPVRANDPSLQVRLADTLQFGSIEGTCRMAGVGPTGLRRLIAKEITDNALDECDTAGRRGQVAIRRDGNLYTVEDGRSTPQPASST